MTEENKSASAENWTKILSGAASGANSAMSGASSYATSKREAKEAKRRTLANIMNQAKKRGQGLFRTGQDHEDDMTDHQSQAIQQIARGFIESLQGSTK